MFVQRFKVISRQRATKPIPTQGMPGVVSRAIVFSIRIGGSEIVGRVIVWTPTLILSFLLLFKQIYHSFKLPRDFRNIKRQSFSTLREKEIWKNRQDLIFSSQNSNPEIFLFIMEWNIIPPIIYPILFSFETQNMNVVSITSLEHVSSLPFERERNRIKKWNDERGKRKKRRGKKKGERERERGSKRRWKVKPEITKGSCDVCSLIREF